MEWLAGVNLWGLWVEADPVARITAVLLLVMSVATWYLVLTKAVQIHRLRREASEVPVSFWAAGTLEEAVAKARAMAPSGAFTSIADAALNIGPSPSSSSMLAATLERSDYVSRILRRALQRSARRLDAGLSVLASVGATAPFVGLFGTVWGIYQALTDIGTSGQVGIDKVAGPVGEALIMTALGIAVAVPAVLAYNFVLRANRAIAQELDGFTHDLHAYLLRAVKSREPRIETATAAPSQSSVRG